MSFIRRAKRGARSIWAPLHYFLFRRRVVSKRTTRDGIPLQAGITYCLVAKDEEVTLSYTLPSLIPLFDQIICIDNGSRDKSLEIMRTFAEKHKHDAEILVLSMPDSSYVEVRNEYLKHVRYTWYQEGAADFYFPRSYMDLRPKLLRMKVPTAVRFGRVDIWGTPNRVHIKFGIHSEGEYFLRHFMNHLRYQEVGNRFTAVIIPKYYRLVEFSNFKIAGLDCARTNERFFFRSFRMDYRTYDNEGLGDLTFEQFQSVWLKHVFQTSDAGETKYRMGLLMAGLSRKMTKDEQQTLDTFGIEFKDFPFEIITDPSGKELRIDKRDNFWQTYQPTSDDLAFDPHPERFHNLSWRFEPFRLVANP